MLTEVPVEAMLAVEEMEAAAEEVMGWEEEVTAKAVAARGMEGKVVEEGRAMVAGPAAVEVAQAFQRDQ